MKRTTVAVAILGLTSGAIALVACSDGGAVTLHDSDGGDGDASVGAGDSSADTSDERVPGDTCGSPPYVTLGVVVLGQSITAQTPLPGAKFTTPLCPDRYTLTDDAGRFNGKISKSTAFYGRFEAPNYIQMLTPEESFGGDTKDYKVVILPSIFGSLVKGFSATTTAIFLGAMKNGGSGACDQLDGITFSVVGHPEATIVYYSADQIPSAIDGATSTTASGRASITGLAPNQLVELEAQKAGCVVATKHNEFTGRAPLEAGWMTLMPAWIGNLPDAGSDAGSDTGIADAADGG